MKITNKIYWYLAISHSLFPNHSVQFNNVLYIYTPYENHFSPLLLAIIHNYDSLFTSLLYSVVITTRLID